ncbi:MAG TPA: DNA repair exonuclease [bacterium]|nr:DNA repair exonuclease [bacterium]
MSVRLLHTSDVHLGATFKVLGERGRDQARQLRDTFGRVTALAVAEHVAVVLIAGDLFDSIAAARAHVGVAAEHLAVLGGAGIRTCVIAGNHDPYTEGSAGLWQELARRCPGLTVFTPEQGAVVFSDLDLTVVGRAATRRLSTESPLAGLPVSRTTRYLVALAHGGVERTDIPAQFAMISARDIARSGVDYLALGDWHSTLEVSAARGEGTGATAWYSGAPEMIDLDEGDSGNVLLVTLDAPGRAQVERRRVGRRRAARLPLDLAITGGDEAVRKTIRAQADPDLALVVTLTGLVALETRVDAERIREELQGEFFRLELRDESHLRPDGIDAARYPDGTVLGRFVHRMRDEIARRGEDERAIAEDALAYGVALLEGRELLR